MRPYIQSLIFFILAALSCLVLVLTDRAEAVELKFTWTPNTDATEGYYLIMDGDQIVQDIQSRDISSTTYTLTDETECHAFMLVAYNQKGNTYSLPSSTRDSSWCPRRPDQPKQFLLTVEPLN